MSQRAPVSRSVCTLPWRAAYLRDGLASRHIPPRTSPAREKLVETFNGGAARRLILAAVLP